MSIRSLARLAVDRDRAEPNAPVRRPGRSPGRPKPGPDGPAPTSGSGDDATSTDPVQRSADVLTSVIPTEPLAAYTTLVALVSTTVGTTGSHLPLRWWMFVGFIIITAVAFVVAYYREATGEDGLADPRNQRRIPLGEGLATLIAAASWGLAMPGGPLAAQLAGTVRTLTTTIVIVGGATVLGLIAVPRLTRGSRTPGETRSTAPSRRTSAQSR